MMMQLSEADHTRITAAIRDLESSSAAEILCVVAPGSGEYRFTPVLWSAIVALIVPWLLWWFTRLEVTSILLLQMIVFGALLFVLSLHKIRLFLTPRGLRRIDVEHAAERQFRLLGVMRTRRRAGILIYVSMAERVAVILPDEAARAVLTIETTRRAVAALTGDLRRNAPVEGFVAAIAIMGDALKNKLPAITDEENELTDQVIEL
jgi:putative membrane protein